MRRTVLIGTILTASVMIGHLAGPFASARRAHSASQLTSLGGGWVQIPLDSRPTSAQTVVGPIFRGPLGLLGIGSQGNGSSPATEVMWFSRDGRFWRRAPHPPATVAMGAPSGPVAATTQGFVALGAGGTATWTSTDGLTWHQISAGTPLPQGIGIAGITVGGPGLVAVGGGLPGRPGYVLQSKTRAVVWVSRDGSSWTQVKYDKATFGGAEMFGVTAGGPGLVAVGRTYPAESGEHAVVWTSPDGRVWHRQPEGQFGNGNGMYRVLQGKGTLLALGETEPPNSYLASLAWTSPDGITWKQVPESAFGQGLVSGATAAGPGFLSVGQQDSTPTLWYSPDGMTWEKEAGDEIFRGDTTQVTGVALVGDSIVVVGNVRQHDKPGSTATAWIWSPSNPQGPVSPLPRPGLDPKALRLRLSDLPAGYHPWEQGYPGICDLEDRPDPGGRCAKLVRALGRYSAYWTEYVDMAHQVFVDATVVVAHSAVGARAAMRLADLLVNPDISNLKVKPLPDGGRIGQETRRYATWSLGFGQAIPAYALVWREGRVMGAVTVAVGHAGLLPETEILKEAGDYATVMHRHLTSGPLSSGLELTPQSAPVAVGRSYPFRLYTHCGVDYNVDFDRSLWDLADPAWQSQNGNPPSSLGNPYQEGTMTLLDPDHAGFNFSGGSILYVRHVGPELVPGPCS